MKSNDAKRMQAAGNMAWLDLEMTGLDADRDVIVQAAIIITDKDLNAIEEWSGDVWHPPEALAGMSPFVRDMHTKTGLLGRLPTARLDIHSVESELMKRVAGLCPYPAVLCGNSIWNDRKFLDRGMPGLSRYFHYRMLDVSALKLVAETYYGPAMLFKKAEAGKHEALADVRKSIEEFRHYRKTLLVPV